MAQHESRSAMMPRVLIAVFVALMAAAIALVPQVVEAQTVPDRRAVSNNTEDNGLPIWYQDAAGQAHRVYQCLGDAELCAIEEPEPGAPPEPLEVVYWSAETSMPVGRAVGGRQGEARLVMAVEGAFDADAGDAPITGSVISVGVDGLNPNTVYTVSHPYGTFRVRTNGEGEFPRNNNTLNEAGCDIEPGDECNFAAATRHPIFNNFLRPANVPWTTNRSHLSNPEVPVNVEGSLIRNARGNPQNYFRIEGPNAGGQGQNVQTSFRFSVVAQLERDTDTDPAPEEPEE